MFHPSKLTRRLLPLYAASFLQSFVLWYAIEKLFMVSIGFDNATIGLMIAVYSVTILITETPSGILADRWSRKGVLILASLALIASSMIGGLSYNIPAYLVCAAIWGIYHAMMSGTYQSIIYDTLVEEEGHAKNYKRLYGLIDVASGIGLAVSSLIGGAVAFFLSPRATFFVTIPAIIISLIFLWRFQEPRLHKAEVSVPMKQHIALTFNAVLKHRTLFPVLLGIMLLSVTVTSILEFSQLWLIAIAAPVILYGPVNALVLSSFGISGYFAKFAASFRVNLMILGASLLSILMLIITRNLISIIISIFLLATCIFITRITLEHQLHDHLPSKLRAGASSAVSTFSRIIIIPFILLLGFIAQQQTIFTATYLILFVFLLGAISTAIALRPKTVS